MSWFSLALPALLPCPVALVSWCQQAESSGNQLGVAWQPRVQLLQALWQWQGTAGRAQGHAPFFHRPLTGQVKPSSASITFTRASRDVLLKSHHCIDLQFPCVFCFWNYRFQLSLQLHDQLKSCSLCQKVSSTACSFISCSKARNSSPMYRFLPASQSLLFSSGENRDSWRSLSHLWRYKQHHLHFSAPPRYSIVCYQAASGECRFPFGCMALHGSGEGPSTTAEQDCFNFSRMHFSWECFTRLPKRKNIAK